MGGGVVGVGELGGEEGHEQWQAQAKSLIYTHRRASAASFSIYLRYSSSVVACVW